MSKIKQDRKASVTIQFATPAAALRWFEEAQEAGVLQTEAGLFEQDSLDASGDNGVPGANEFIVRRAGKRANQIVLLETQETVGTES